MNRPEFTRRQVVDRFFYGYGFNVYGGPPGRADGRHRVLRPGVATACRRPAAATVPSPVPSTPMWRRRLAWSLAWGMAGAGVAVAVAAATVAWPVDVQAIDVCTPVALVTAWVTPRHVVVEGESAADFIRADPDLDPATPVTWEWHRHGIAVRDEQDAIDAGRGSRRGGGM